MLLIQDALLKDGQEWHLNPELSDWKQSLTRSPKLWVKHTPMLAWQWYFWRQNWHEPAAALLASKLSDSEKQGVKQYWVVSPYHANVVQGHIDVLSDRLLTWTEEDAQWLVALLNPMLKLYHMELIAVGACILAKSLVAYDVEMVDFAEFSGGSLPNHMPDGCDALRFMCMMSEMQALLAQSSTVYRQKKGDADISGIWFWGMSTESASCRIWPKTVCDDVCLASLLDESESIDTYTGIEHVRSLNQIPKHCILTGQGMSVLVTKSIIPRFSRQPWLAQKIKSMPLMHQRLLD